MEVKKSPKADLENKKGLFLQIGLCVALVAMIGLFAYSKSEVEIEVLENTAQIIEAEFVEITREEQPQQPVGAPRLQVTSEILNIVRDDKKIDANLTFADFDDNIDFSFNPSDGGGTYEGTLVDDEPFVTVEDMPQFQGGDNSKFRAWVMKQIQYPSIAAENGIQGRVTLTFVIERDGSLTNVQVLNSPDRSLSEEAMRVVKSSPKWTPGKQRGVPVRVRFTLPVDFKLQS